ncbi:MAG: S1/P1 nuclease [Acidobacteriota bacterium]
MKLLGTLLLTLGSADSLLGFGATGHRITAQIAAWELEPAVAREIQRLLDGSSLVEASTWADEIRREDKWRHMSPWHYVNLDPRVGKFEGCPEFSGCLVDALRDAAVTLGDRSRSDEDRLLALRIVVHMMGDLHQPMHVSHASDRGGNRIPVDFFGEEWNLHSLWDTGILSRRDGSWRRLARRIHQTERSIDAEWSDESLLQWVAESYRLAVDVVYPSLPPDARVGRLYVEAYRPLVDQQLHKAGLRMANLLNTVLSSGEE